MKGPTSRGSGGGGQETGMETGAEVTGLTRPAAGSCLVLTNAGALLPKGAPKGALTCLFIER